MKFCRWVFAQTGVAVSLPTGAQWEEACRAGRDSPLHLGGLSDAHHANLADFTCVTFGYIRRSLMGWFQVDGDVDYIVAEGL